MKVKITMLDSGVVVVGYVSRSGQARATLRTIHNDVARRRRGDPMRFCFEPHPGCVYVVGPDDNNGGVEVDILHAKVEATS